MRRFHAPLLLAVLLIGCPPTSTCPDGMGWDGTMCVPWDGDTGTPDAPIDGGGEDPDVPCGGCASDRVCDVTTGDCVECLGTDPSTCTEAGDNACFGGECVACALDDDCEDLGMPQCNVTTHVCEMCTGLEACEDRTDTPVCSEGGCVECIDNDQCTGTNEGCDVETNTCRTFVPQGGSLCGGCVADAECASGQLCIPMMYDDPVTIAADPVFAGNHCLWRSEASSPGPAGACSTIRPFVATRDLTSVDGVTTDVCTLRVSTCDAQADFSSSAIPCTLDAAGNALCGRDGVPDAVCRRLDAGSNRCTVYCVSDDDCPAGVTCDNTTTPRQCRL